MASNIKAPKKLIEVALPLDDINEAAAREKSIRHGHPSTLHLWWARRPLAAARAVLFAQMVNDPGGERGYFAGKTKKQADQEREKLFDIIRDLVKWENSNNPAVLERAREAIRQSWRETCELNKGKPGFDPDKLPAFHDPFAGGGAIPLEAQRLGLESYASDLNPVAVLLNKAMIEIPPKFAGRKPIGPIPKNDAQTNLHEDWSGLRGLAEDVRRYGFLVLEEARNRLAHLYPIIDLPKRLGSGKATVLTWLWCRTVASPNPASEGLHVPLAKSFQISSKSGNEAWIVPVCSKDGNGYSFELYEGTKPHIKGTVSGKGAVCIITNTPISLKYIRDEGTSGRIGHRLMAAIVQTNSGKYIVPASELTEPDFASIQVSIPESGILHWAGCTNVVVYGMKKFRDLFNSRQLMAMATFCQILNETKNRIQSDAIRSGMVDDNISLENGGRGAKAYSEAISVYMSCAIGRAADYWNTLASWEPSGQFVAHAFTKHALPMIWDYGEINPLADGGGSWKSAIGWIVRVIENLPGNGNGSAIQIDAAKGTISTAGYTVVSTDPPYYDNVPYANLADFFYLWMRQCLRDVFPNIFGTMQTPKSDELVASHSLYQDIDQAMQHFMDGMTKAILQIHLKSHEAIPVTIYYAFKQSETKDSGTYSSGWESFLESVIRAGFVITGTWPIRTERSSRSRAIGSNALASSIVLVCRKRDTEAASISRRDFQRELREEVPQALETMIGGAEGASPIAPVDLAQSAIGPGMAIFSKYQAVLNQDGSPMSVHDALVMINREITDFLNPDSGNFDNDTLFCSAWFDQYGWSTGPFGEAETLSRAKGTTVDGIKQAGVIESGGGKVRLLKWEEYPSDWDPKTDNRMPVWEALHQIIRALNQKGESEAGALLARMPEKAEVIRQLAYHLYTLCERKKWAEEARAYNELITSWHGIMSASHEVGHAGTQKDLFG